MKSVLIVDDQKNIRELIKITLEFEDCQLTEAESGDRAMEIVGDLRPDLILLDVMMPGRIDGYEVCRRVKSDPALAATPVVLLTARAQQADREAAVAAGADHYLPKPFSPKQLLELVRQLLGAA
jgi:CheY-like chemotaxis protein